MTVSLKHNHIRTLLVLRKLNMQKWRWEFLGKKKKTCSDKASAIMLYQLHRYVSKGHLERACEKKKMFMQLLCKLPLKALEFTDVGGHRKAPVHWCSSPDYRLCHLLVTIELMLFHCQTPDTPIWPNLMNYTTIQMLTKGDFITPRKSCHVISDSYLICPSVDHPSPFK